MKILIVASGFTGATLPLANQFAKMGYDVKCYNLVSWQVNSIESIDFDAPLNIPSGKPVSLPKLNRLYSYLSKSVDFYLLPYWKRKMRMEKVLVGRIFPWFNKRLIKKYINYILSENADFINLIVHTERDFLIAEALYKSKIRFCITYHEVLQGLVGNRLLNPVVEKTAKYGTPIILHSQKTANDLIQAICDDTIGKRIHIINFGAFESFLSYGKGCVPKNLPDRYLLYLGHVHPYKGLNYLYDAVMLLGDKLGSIKIVVAGGGYDPIIKTMKHNNRFYVLNNFINNGEVVGIIRHCLAIVCPYIAASQSGLVQTGMVFNKPVIATRVGAFTEVINNGENGFLCEPADAQSLAEAIIMFINTTPFLYHYHVPKKLQWDNIAEQYLQLFKEMSK